MWSFADSLDFSLEDLSGEGTSPLLESTVGKAFFSVKESVRGGFNFATEGNPVRVAAAGKGSSRAMRARRRGSRLPIAMAAADQSLEQSPIAYCPARLHPPEARTMASTPKRPPGSVKTASRSTHPRMTGGHRPDSRASRFPGPAFPGSGIPPTPGQRRPEPRRILSLPMPVFRPAQFSKHPLQPSTTTIEARPTTPRPWTGPTASDRGRISPSIGSSRRARWRNDTSNGSGRSRAWPTR